MGTIILTCIYSFNYICILSTIPRTCSVHNCKCLYIKGTCRRQLSRRHFSKHLTKLTPAEMRTDNFTKTSYRIVFGYTGFLPEPDTG